LSTLKPEFEGVPSAPPPVVVKEVQKSSSRLYSFSRLSRTEQTYIFFKIDVNIFEFFMPMQYSVKYFFLVMKTCLFCSFVKAQGIIEQFVALIRRSHKLMPPGRHFV